MEEELNQWKAEAEKYRALVPSEAALLEHKNKTVPDLEKQMEEEGGQLDKIQEEVEEVSASAQLSTSPSICSAVADVSRQS